MRSETVVDAVADRLNVEKGTYLCLIGHLRSHGSRLLPSHSFYQHPTGSVLDRDADGMAVKLALGETFLVAENREFFKKEGIDLSVLDGARGNKGGKTATARIKTTILVKNLPYSTSQVCSKRRCLMIGEPRLIPLSLCYLLPG